MVSTCLQTPAPLSLRNTGDPRCSVTLLSSRHADCLVVSGVLDAESLPAFTSQVDQLMCTPCRRVVLNLDGVTDIDQWASQVVLGLRTYVLARGGEIAIMWPQQRLR